MKINNKEEDEVLEDEEEETSRDERDTIRRLRMRISQMESKVRKHEDTIDDVTSSMEKNIKGLISKIDLLIGEKKEPEPEPEKKKSLFDLLFS